MVDASNSSSWLNFRGKVTPNVKISKNFILPTILLWITYKFHNNMLGFVGHEYFWMSVWLWPLMLAPKFKVDLEKKFKKPYWVIYHMTGHGQSCTTLFKCFQCLTASQWHHKILQNYTLHEYILKSQVVTAHRSQRFHPILLQSHG